MQNVPTSRQYPAVDIAKLLCAVLIVMIHVPPFGSANATPLAQAGNFFLRFYLGRIAVPFFFISAGFFLFRKTDPTAYDPTPCKQYILRILRLYGVWTVLYLPWVIRDARADGKTLLTGTVSFLRNFLLTGSYNHLWYLPALAVAVALVSWLLRKGVTPGRVLCISFLLYCVGLLGQSWFFLLKPLEGTALFSVLRLYEKIFTTTRNGVFFGFPFVALGMYLAYRPSGLRKWPSGILFLVSMAVLYLEVRFTQGKGEAPGRDMYVFLVPAAYFALSFLLQLSPKSHPRYRAMRPLALLLYLTHLAVNISVSLPILVHFDPTGCTGLQFPLTLFLSVGLSLILLELSRKPHFQWLKKLYQ